MRLRQTVNWTRWKRTQCSTFFNVRTSFPLNWRKSFKGLTLNVSCVKKRTCYEMNSLYGINWSYGLFFCKLHWMCLIGEPLFQHFFSYTLPRGIYEIMITWMNEKMKACNEQCNAARKRTKYTYKSSAVANMQYFQNLICPKIAQITSRAHME